MAADGDQVVAQPAAEQTPAQTTAEQSSAMAADDQRQGHNGNGTLTSSVDVATEASFAMVDSGAQPGMVSISETTLQNILVKITALE